MALVAAIVVALLLATAFWLYRRGSFARVRDRQLDTPDAKSRTAEAPGQNAAEVVQEFIATQVRGGFLSEPEVVEVATDYASDEFSDEIVAQVGAWVRMAFQSQAHAQGAWPEVTDCDRLDDAFASLESQGIVARQNWTCCQTCGHAEIVDEVNQARERGPVLGYTFFHQQDTDSAVEGHGLYLAYGAAGEDDDAAAIGHRVCDALRYVGLQPTWDGKTSSRIRLPLTWQRRIALP